MAVKKGRPWARIALLALLSLFILGASTTVGFVFGTLKNLPALHNGPQPSQTSIILDARGNFLTKLPTVEDRVPVSIDQVPEHVQEAVVAIEDERFYKHWGPDLRGILRAAYVDLVTGSRAQGASTITQQLVRTAFLNPEKTFRRKLQEIIMAIQMERRYTKKEILEMYLNQIFFGHNAYGIQSASQLYFGKDVSQLNLAEGALLAGLIQAPNQYSPFVNLEKARERQALVLKAMVDNNYISQKEADEARKAPLTLNTSRAKAIASYPAPYFVDYVLQQLLSRYDKKVVYNGGLRIYTTIDPEVQKALEEGIKKYIDLQFPLGKGKEVPEAAAVFIDPQTGYIRAMIGGRTHEKLLAFNRAVDARRQPGSAFKPIAVYTPAIDGGYTAASVFDDYPKTYYIPGQEPWTPENYNQKYLGLTPLRRALELSINTIAVKVLEKIGVGTGVDYARRLGITTLVTDRKQPLNDYVLPLALGGLTQGVSPLEMARAYAVLANGGMRVEPIAILKVLDKNGGILEENRPRKELVLSEQTAYVVTDMLKGVITRGTGTTADIGRPAAGKTGTTSQDRDAWFAGYTPDLVGVVWMGFDREKGLGRIYGSTIPAPIWRHTMLAAHRDLPVRDFPEPKNIIRVKVCLKSGDLPGKYCAPSDLAEEIFIKGTEPQDPCTVHVAARVCTENHGQLATQYCPPSSTVEKVFIKRPEPWVPFTDENGNRYVPQDAGLELPTQRCTMHGPAGGQGENGSLPPITATPQR